MATWRPIDSDAKRGEKVLIFQENWSFAPIAHWAEYPEQVPDESGNYVTVCGWILEDADLDLGLEEGFLGWSEDVMPTHYSKLPVTT